MTPRRFFSFFCIALVASLTLAGTVAAETYEEALARAEKLIEVRKDYAAALEAYKEAEKLTGQPTFDHWSGATNALLALRKYNDAAQYAEVAISAASDDLQKATGHTQLGLALIGVGKVSKRKLQAAVESLRVANDLKGREAPLSRYMLAMALLKLEQDEEAIKLLSSVVEDWPEHELVKPAQALIEQPRRARERMMPIFEAETLAGEVISNSSLRGKVVLIDVWATWCAPCRSSVPHLKKLHEKMEGENFTIVGISVDGDEKKLRDYIADYQMKWPQIWDQYRELATARFQATGYPTYIVVDHEGVVRFVDSGWSDQLGFAIDREVRSALKAAKKAAKKS